MLRAGCRALLAWVRAPVSSPAVGGYSSGRPISVFRQHFRKVHEQWRYPVDEMLMERLSMGTSNKHMFTLSTSQPVPSKVFEEALLHLSMKVDSLQMCLRERNGRLWFTAKDVPKIDFKVLEDGNLYDVMRVTGGEPYDLAVGPLWRARLLPRSLNEVCVSPQVTATFPHHYHLILDFDNFLHDGISVYRIVQRLFKILDDLLDGINVDDKLTDLKFHDRREIKILQDQIKENLLKDPRRLNALLEERSKVLARVPLITEAYGDPQESFPITNSLSREILDEELLHAFSAKCMALKVTFNSGFTGVINTALVEMVHYAGILRDCPTVCSYHPVDSRRYFERKSLKDMVLGYHNTPLTNTIDTPFDVRNCFWKYVTEMDANFREKISNFAPLEEWVVDKLLQERCDLKRKFFHDYCFTNVFSPRLTTFGDGKHVQLTDYSAWWHITRQTYGAIFLFTKVDNITWLQLLHSTGFMTQENAAKLLERVVNVFNDTAKAVE